MSVNVDPREISHFSALAARWWDPQGEMATLHHINPLRLRYIDQCLNGCQGKRIADVGCGGGLVAEGLAALGAKVTGIDLAGDALDVAREHASAAGLAVDYRQISVEAFADQQAGQYDAVTCLEMLEHVPDPESVITACARLLKPGGELILSTINRNAKAFALAIVGAEWVLNLVPRGTHDYAKLIKPSELARGARGAGLEVLAIRGLRYNPLLKAATLSDDVDVNYFMHVRKPT